MHTASTNGVRLINSAASDEELLTGLSLEELPTLANGFRLISRCDKQSSKRRGGAGRNDG